MYFVKSVYFCCLNEAQFSRNQAQFVYIIFRKKFKVGLLVHCPTPANFCYIRGRSETQPVKLEVHPAQIKYNWYHFRPKIFNGVGGGQNVPKCEDLKTFLYGFSDVIPTHDFRMQKLVHVPTDFSQKFVHLRINFRTQKLVHVPKSDFSQKFIKHVWIT